MFDFLFSINNLTATEPIRFILILKGKGIIYAYIIRLIRNKEAW